MNKEVIKIKDKEIICIKGNNPHYLLVNLIDAREKDNVDIIAEEISKESSLDILYVSLIIDDWNKDLSPWIAPAVFGKEDFKGDAYLTLRFISDDLLPHLRNKYMLDKDIKLIIGGYSLAGLFSLWATYQIDIISAVAAVSPSVWYLNFMDYVKANKIKTDIIYLSLGDKEELTKNKIMMEVGNNIRELDTIYSSDTRVYKNILEWNQGNHFVNASERMIKGFVWCIKTLNK